MARFPSVFRSPMRLLKVKLKRSYFIDPNWWRALKLKLRGVGDEFQGKQTLSGVDLRVRKYRDYNAYISHQSSKLDFLFSRGAYKLDGTNLETYEAKFRPALVSRLRKIPLLTPGSAGLCLGARLGTEVRAFHDCGVFSVGIDLNPGVGNRHVLEGDFHAIQFPSQSVDFVYCNSIDHVFDIEKFFNEIKRLLKRKGFLIAEVQRGNQEGSRDNTGYWESLDWANASDIERLIEAAGFVVVDRMEFTIPWEGLLLLARRVE